MKLGDPTRMRDVPAGLLHGAAAAIRGMLEDSIDRMKTDAGDIPVVAVGGGSFLIPPALRGVSEVVKIEHGDVANAVGAAIAQISGECDQVFQDFSRDDAIGQVRRIAEQRATRAGADSATLKLVEVEDLPLAYMPGNSLRVRVRIVGDIA